MVIGDDSSLFEQVVQLGASTVEDDGVETDTVEEGDGGGEGVEFIGEDGASDLDDSKLLRLDG